MSTPKGVPRIDPKNLNSTKAFLVMLGLLLAAYFLFDAAVNNFYSTAKNKTDILKNIYELRKEIGIDSLTNNYLDSLEKKVIHKRSFYENAIDYISYVFVPGHKSPMSDSRNGFLQLISSSWLWIYIVFYVPFSENKKQNKIRDASLNIKAIVILCGIAILNCYIFNLIPIVFWPVINYLINGLLQYVELRIFSQFLTTKYVPLKAENQ